MRGIAAARSVSTRGRSPADLPFNLLLKKCLTPSAISFISYSDKGICLTPCFSARESTWSLSETWTLSMNVNSGILVELSSLSESSWFSGFCGSLDSFSVEE